MDEANPYRSPGTHQPVLAVPQDRRAPASGSPFLEHFQPPPLRILHLMGWITAAAVLVRIGMVFDAARADVPPAEERVFFWVLRFNYTVFTAACMVGGGILLMGWMRGVRGRLQPGHWLVVVNALSAGLSYMIFLAHLALMNTVFQPWEDEYSYFTFMWGFAFLSLVQLLLWYAAARRTSDGTRWNVFFGTVSAVFGIRLLFCVLDVLTYANWTYRSGAYFSVVLGVILLIVVARDRRRGPPRDWLHWLGVVAAVCYSLNALAWIVWRLFVGPEL
jgi:hypothetical protein